MDYESLILNLSRIDVEEPWVEFKSNKNDPKMIGEDISALSNSALIHNKPEAFMIWGIRDEYHELVGTRFDIRKEKVGNEDLLNWLRHSLSDNFEFLFKDVNMDGKRFVVLTITPPRYTPSRFNKVAYIRDGNHTKPLSKIPQLERKLWECLNNYDYESTVLKSDLDIREVTALLDMDSIVSNLKLQVPTDERRMTEILTDNGLAVKQPDGHLGVTVLGAILFAKKLKDFKELETKTVRIVQYLGRDKTQIVRQYECEKGYAIQFGRIIESISMLIPASQNIVPDGRMVQSFAYPMDAVREVVANALIHQDLSDPMHVVIEILEGRLTVTNPGTMLISPDRILDSPPLSRNRLLPEMFRRMGLCEQLGSGWDRIVSLCEGEYLPTPKAQVYESSTVVTMFERIPFEDMAPADRLWACYMHTCRMHMQGLEMTNQTLRERFGMEGKNATVAISRLIRAARDKGLIKNSESGNGPKNQGYIPYWA